MKLSRVTLLLLLAGGTPAIFAADSAPATPAAQPANPVFGNYEAIVYDADLLQGVRVDSNGAIYLKFKPEKRDAIVRIRISMAQGSHYRKWADGEDELVALENGHRAPNAWTDQVHTTANYIEYRAGDHLFLHLKKLKS
jgi:hypothetical protein